MQAALEYVHLGEDHTTIVDEPGYPTIQAQVADDDLATAKIIDQISHSPYQRSTVVIVVRGRPTGHRRFAQRVPRPARHREPVDQARDALAHALQPDLRGRGDRPDPRAAAGDRLLADEPPAGRPLHDDARHAALLRRRLRGRSLPIFDRKHGIASFTEPDETDPAVATAAQWRAVRRTRPPYVLGVDGVPAPRDGG